MNLKFAQELRTSTCEKFRFIWIYDPVWSVHVNVFIPNSAPYNWSDLKAFCRRNYRTPTFPVVQDEERPIGRAWTTRCSKNQSTVVFIYLREWQYNPRHVAVLAHELQHVVQQVGRDRGILADGQSGDEAQAYALDFLLGTALELLPKKAVAKTRAVERMRRHEKIPVSPARPVRPARKLHAPGASKRARSRH